MKPEKKKFDLFFLQNQPQISYPKAGPVLAMSNTCPGLRICLNLRKNFSPCPPPDLQFTNTIMGDPGRDSATCHPFLPIEVERKKTFLGLFSFNNSNWKTSYFFFYFSETFFRTLLKQNQIICPIFPDLLYF